MKHKNGRIIVWGVYKAAGDDKFMLCDKSFNAKEYIEISEIKAFSKQSTDGNSSKHVTSTEQCILTHD